MLEWSSSRPRTDGAEGMSEKMEQFLADQMEAGRVLDAVIGQNEEQAGKMWRIREGVAEASRAEGPGLSYDISVSISRIPAFIDKGIKAAFDVLPSIRPYPLGHIGDGNLHFSFMGPKGMDRETLKQYSPAITRAVNDLVRDMPDAISAGHRIGISKIDDPAPHPPHNERHPNPPLKRPPPPHNTTP